MIGAELYQQLCTGRDSARAIEACSWLNLLAACFDGVLDERPASVPELLDRITLGHLDDALDLERSTSKLVFNHDMSTDPAPGFVAFVAEEAFRVCRELALSRVSPIDWRVFATSVRDAYDAEVATMQLRIENTFVNDQALVALSRKSILPVAMLGHAVLLCADRRPSVAPAAIRSLMETLGSLVAEIDDVVDAPADLDAGRWSAFLLGTCRFTGEEVRRMGTAGTLSAIVERQIPRQVAARIARELDEVAELSARTLAEPDRFLVNCQYWLAGWLTGGDSAQALERQPRL